MRWTKRARPGLIAIAALVLLAGTSSAATIQCGRDAPCIGTQDDDEMYGTTSSDDMHGRGGFDMLTGRAGPDVLQGGDGEDELRGGRGRDVLRAGPDTDDYGDHLYGGKGSDELHGGISDVLSGGPGRDTLYGSRGTQWFYLNEGNDTAFGRGGSDRFIISVVEWGRDTISDSKNGDNFLQIDFFFSYDPSGWTPLRINLNSRADRPEVKRVDGSASVDWNDDVINSVIIRSGRDTIRGNEHANLINSRGGKDTIFGGAGNDRINTAYDNGADTIDCGPGDADEVTYDADEDTVTNCEILNPVG